MYNILIRYFYTVQKNHNINLVTVCHHTKIWHYYWLIPPWYFFFMTHLFCNWKFVTLHFPSIYFSLPPSPPHPATNCLFSVSVTLFLFCFVHLLFSLFTFHQGSPKIVFLSLCMLSHFSHVQLFVTPVSCVHGIFQARILEWVVMITSRGSSQPRDQTCVLCLLHWQAGSLPLAPHISKIIWYFNFSIWLTPLSKIPTRFIHVTTNGEITFYMAN